MLGAGASAMDNAVMALEAKALGVTLYCRRSELQRVQPFKWLSFPGFLRHFSELDNEWRWKFMSYLLTLREAFLKKPGIGQIGLKNLMYKPEQIGKICTKR